MARIFSRLLEQLAVLRNDGSDSFGMRQCDAESDRRTVIENVDCVALEADCLGEAVDGLGQVLERVVEPFPVGRLRESEAWQVGCRKMVPVGQGRNEVTEHVPR